MTSRDEAAPGGWPVYLRALQRGALLVIQSAPQVFWRHVALSVIFGAGPALLLWLGKVVIDYVAATAPLATSFWGWISGAPAAIVATIAAFLLLNLALDSVDTLTAYQLSTLRDRVEQEAQERLLSKVSGFNSVAVFENPRLLNLLVLAEGGIGQLLFLALKISNWLDGWFAVIPSILLSATIAWWVPLLVFAASAPSIHYQFALERRQWGTEVDQVTNVRGMRAQQEVLTKPGYAKDLRMYGLAGYFLHGWKRLVMRRFAALQAVRRHGMVMTLLWSLVSGLSTGLPYVYVIFQAVRGQLTLGDVALFAGLIFQVRRSLYMVVGNLGDMQQIALQANAFFELLDYDEAESAEYRVVMDNDPLPVDRVDELPTIELVDVSFTYPGMDRPAVRGVNLRIEAGETVVIVGENGAGKTTLAKLLCRLYGPSSGRILFDGQDYLLIPLDRYRDASAVLFQDFARFPATLRENIGFGDLGALDDDDKVRQAADRMGLTGLVETLSKGLETPLSKELEDGVELSGGQWQRVAIARALMRADAKLVILDEPTASLDPRTEFEALSLFRRWVQDKTAVIISHRLALARIATTVVVMEQGQIIEQGTHAGLMQRGGTYAEMFNRQASSYVDLDPSISANRST